MCFKEQAPRCNCAVVLTCKTGEKPFHSSQSIKHFLIGTTIFFSDVVDPYINDRHSTLNTLIRVFELEILSFMTMYC